MVTENDGYYQSHPVTTTKLTDMAPSVGKNMKTTPVEFHPWLLTSSSLQPALVPAMVDWNNSRLRPAHPILIKPVGPGLPVPWTTECTGVIFRVSWRYGLKMETPQYPQRDGLMISGVSTKCWEKERVVYQHQHHQSRWRTYQKVCEHGSLHHPVRASVVDLPRATGANG